MRWFNSIIRTISVIFLILLVFTLLLFTIRLFSNRQIDDVSSLIPCEEKYLLISDELYIVPNFNNIPISNNISWCNYILSLNKTLALHGVYHEYKEFSIDRNQDYLDKGIIIFEDCFNKTPSSFKPPQLAISNNNKKLIKNNFNLNLRFNQITHKVYHCNDSGIFSNKFIDWF
ncbi:MAG: DUF2334 domain-containing protein [Candidatus Pacearchaeota archaeon]|jgi:hypothetical protein